MASFDADGLRLVFRAVKAVESVHVHLHLAEILVRQLAELEVDEHEAAEQTIVKDEVDVEVVAVDGDSLLPRDKTEPLAELQQEAFDAIDDGPLEIALVRRRLLFQVGSTTW
jgi:hypothetical protein